MITYLNKNYDSDRDNIMEWFGHEVEPQGFGWGMVTNLVYEINQTSGLMETLTFSQDIKDAGLEIDFINIFYVKPKVRTSLYNYKIRLKPRQLHEPLMDESLPDRKCLLAIPVENTAGYIQRISDAIKVNDGNMKEKYEVIEAIKIDNRPFIMRSDVPVYTSNVKGSEPLYVIHVGFFGDPSYEEVVAKLG